MAISLTTDWSKIRYIMFVMFFVNALLAATVTTGLAASGKQKRQLFRENLLPQLGGRIPDGAFDPSRLVLNKFSQIGLYSPDGYHLTREYSLSHHPKRISPNTVKVRLYPDNRYIAPPGRYHSLPTVDTTYFIRKPINFVLLPPVSHYTSFSTLPYHSLKILRQYKYQKVNLNHKGFSNEVLPENYTPSKKNSLRIYKRYMTAIEEVINESWPRLLKIGLGEKNERSQ